MSHTNSKTRHDFVLLFDIKNGNPNGDPDADNAPRVDAETQHGLVSDVAIKRKVRNYAQIYGDQQIFIQSEVALNDLILQAQHDAGLESPAVSLNDDEDLIEWFRTKEVEDFNEMEGAVTYLGVESDSNEIEVLLTADMERTAENSALRKKLGKVAKDLAKAAKNQKVPPKQREQLARATRDIMRERYYDIRMFGAVLATGSNAGANAGQVRGPMQLTFARSIDPVYSQAFPITRSARTTNARMRTGATEFGRKNNVLYGLYRAHGFFTAKFAEDARVTDADLELFWNALENLFVLDRAAARAEMAVQGVYIFTHENPRGNHPAHKLFERIQVVRKESEDLPRAFADYEVTVNRADFPTGVTLTFLDGVSVTRLVG